AETKAELNALWAARLLGVTEVGAIAAKLLADTSAPIALRVEAARCLGAFAADAAVTTALQRALSDPDLAVRGEAASSLGKTKAPLDSVKRAPLDPVILARVARAQALPMSGLEKSDTR